MEPTPAPTGVDPEAKNMMIIVGGIAIGVLLCCTWCCWRFFHKVHAHHEDLKAATEEHRQRMSMSSTRAIFGERDDEMLDSDSDDKVGPSAPYDGGGRDKNRDRRRERRRWRKLRKRMLTKEGFHKDDIKQMIRDEERAQRRQRRDKKRKRQKIRRADTAPLAENGQVRRKRGKKKRKGKGKGDRPALRRQDTTVLGRRKSSKLRMQRTAALVQAKRDAAIVAAGGAGAAEASLRVRLASFYRAHLPELVPRVPAIVSAAIGQYGPDAEREISASLARRFGETLAPADGFDVAAAAAAAGGDAVCGSAGGDRRQLPRVATLNAIPEGDGGGGGGGRRRSSARRRSRARAAATTIEAAFRGGQGRRRARDRRREWTAAATTIEAAFRGGVGRHLARDRRAANRADGRRGGGRSYSTVFENRSGLQAWRAKQQARLTLEMGQRQRQTAAEAAAVEAAAAVAAAARRRQAIEDEAAAQLQRQRTVPAGAPMPQFLIEAGWKGQALGPMLLMPTARQHRRHASVMTTTSSLSARFRAAHNLEEHCENARARRSSAPAHSMMARAQPLYLLPTHHMATSNT